MLRKNMTISNSKATSGKEVAVSVYIRKSQGRR